MTHCSAGDRVNLSVREWVVGMLANTAVTYSLSSIQSTLHILTHSITCMQYESLTEVV